MKTLPPQCVFIAGPNGGGKSTVYWDFRRRNKLGGEFVYINSDDNFRRLTNKHGSSTDLAAGKMSLKQLTQAIDAGIDFQFETTLSSHQSIKSAMSARAAGYEVGLIYVILQNAELHCLRVRSRHEKGGHFIPEDVVMRRYKKSLENLKRNIQLFDRGVILDNTDPVKMRTLFEVSDGTLHKFPDFDPAISLDQALYSYLLGDEKLDIFDRIV